MISVSGAKAVLVHLAHSYSETCGDTTEECLDLAHCYSRLILSLAETTQRKCMDLADCYSRTLRVSVVNVLFCLCFVCVCSGEICRICKIYAVHAWYLLIGCFS